jgi:hypothetical protein
MVIEDVNNWLKNYIFGTLKWDVCPGTFISENRSFLNYLDLLVQFINANPGPGILTQT